VIGGECQGEPGQATIAACLFLSDPAKLWLRLR
jgi:hypothetical protein